MDTSKTLYEIEVALAKSSHFNFVKNIIAFNVNGISSKLPIWHECDMLVLSKSGYLTEIEIKRSWIDFLADFKKEHHHESELIKYFYYCVPISILDKVYDYLYTNDVKYTGIITYTEDLLIRVHQKKLKPLFENDEVGYASPAMDNYRKLFLEEQLELARYGAMRNILLKEKIIDLQKQLKETEYGKQSII